MPPQTPQPRETGKAPSPESDAGASPGASEKRPVYTVAIAAQLVGLAPRTLRAYEEAGLIEPARAGRGKQRLYSAQDLRWLRCINEMVHEEGYTLRSIRRLLDFAPCWEIRRCPAKTAARCAESLRIPGQTAACAQAEEPNKAQGAEAPAEESGAGQDREQRVPVHVRLIYGLEELGAVMHCSRCINAERRLRRVAGEFGSKVLVTTHDVLSLEARRYGVLMTPAIVINDEVVSLGKSPSEQRLRELIEKYLAASLRPGSRRANQ